jgi:hypothetical protein
VAVLNIITWLWGEKYNTIYVDRLHAALRYHLKQPFRFLLMTERDRKVLPVAGIERHAIKDEHLTKINGCFARLRMFDRGWQQNRKLEGRIVCLDLDVVITGRLDGVLDRKEPIVLLQGANSMNPCPYNNSVFMFQAGVHQELWDDFSLAAVTYIKQFKFPDDQGWFWHRLNKPAVWKVGSHSGIYAFHKPGWPPGEALPSDAKMVVFPGHRDPSQFTHLPWVRREWAGSNTDER